MLLLKGSSTNLLQAPVQRQQLEKHRDHKVEEYNGLTLGYVLEEQELGESSQGTEVLASTIVPLFSSPHPQLAWHGQVHDMSLFISLANTCPGIFPDITPLNLLA